MDIDRERRLHALIDRAVDLEPTARRRFLEQACADDPELFEEARAALTERQAMPGTFLRDPAWFDATTLEGAAGRPAETDSPAEDATAPTAPSPEAPIRLVSPSPEAPTEAMPRPLTAIGPYRLLDKLGEGGMGHVFLAEQQEPLRRRVALKLMRSSLIGRDARARFEAERQALARLSHPNVGAILDAGTTRDGVPFFAMELVEGESLIRYCDRRRLSIEQRLRLMIAVCRGVEHAHRKQILHRDLKPSNVLVVEVDGKPIPKIIDFGIAKALDQPLTDATVATVGGMIGTPNYMSPEALEGSADLDTRTDVYSLGIMLYEVLAGVRPFDQDSMAGLLSRIRRQGSPRPSTRWSGLGGDLKARVADRRRITAATLHRRLRDELDWIVLRAIAQDREERYGSATELADDLERYLRHEPVVARPPSLGYLAGRWISRYRVPVAAGTLLVVSLVTGVVARGIEAERANRAAAAAEAALEESLAARAEAEETINLLIGLFRQASPDYHQGREVTALEVVEKALDALPQSFPDRPLSRARFMDHLSSIFSQLGRLDTAERLALDALELRRTALEEEHPDIAFSLAQIGYAYERQGKLEIAEDYYRRGLEIGQRTLPPDADWLAKVSGNLAILLSRAGRYAEAEPHYRRALEIREANPESAEDGGRLGFPSMNLGLNYALQGRVDEAEGLIRRAYDLFREHYGLENPYTLSAMAALARIKGDRGDLDGAEEETREVLTRIEALLGPEHPLVAEVLHQLAGIVRERRPGDDEAAELYLRAIEIREKTHGADSADLAKSLVGLARTRRSQERTEEADRLLRRAVAIYGRVLPAGHPDLASAEALLAELSGSSGQGTAGNR